MAGEEICSGTREHGHRLMDVARGPNSSCDIGVKTVCQSDKGSVPPCPTLYLFVLETNDVL